MKEFILAAILSLLLTLSGTALASYSSDVNSGAQDDWVINVAANDSAYLAYPGSTLKPLTKLLVTYRINPRSKLIPNVGQDLNYEELWYHNEQAVGSRRLGILSLPATSQGIIRIVPSTATFHSDQPVAGAIVRLFLDLGLQRCQLNAVYVPTAIFRAVINDLSYFHFTTKGPAQTLGNPQILSIPISSDPPGLGQVVYYYN